MQEAMLTLHTHLPNIPDSTERRFLESGLHAIQRRSGPMKITPDAFVITSLDIVIHDDRKLGEGGFASVFEGDWRGTKVAVKLLERGIPSSAIQQEIDVWKRLRHPNILQFFGACSIADPPFMVCALKSNGDAVDYLRRNPSVNRSRLLYEASLGLVYLHQHSVIHGDLKATNILVDSRGEACLSDFGLSRIKVHSTTIRKSKPSEMQGTTRWMSPEQMSVGVTTKKTDVYSFAMTIYEVSIKCILDILNPNKGSVTGVHGSSPLLWYFRYSPLATAGTRSEGHHEHRPATQTPHTTQSRNKQTTSRPNLMKESQSEPAMIIIRDTSSELPEPSLESHGSSVQPPVIIFEDQYGGTRPSKKAKGKKHLHHQTPVIPPPSYYTRLPTGPAPNAEHWYPDAVEGSSKSGWLAKLIGKKKKTNNAMGPWTQMPQPVSPPLYPSGSASPYSYPSMLVPAPRMVIPGSYSPPTQISIPRPPVPPPLPVHRSPSPSPSTHIVIHAEPR
ncbi:hypothetical protein PHLCEN_2v1388 [Hermanssonia centrifuga]|uniref:Protein kinase domain-containing protein n=1 Tax=Hermanssonia centrifuga TaxID=98765 RepID=A0A2R6S390_9APHY|nr:hypothetical protein PHLCEN_2v1388 [Hermanssonia centrifuga]